MTLEDKKKIDCLRAEYGSVDASHSFLSLFLYGEENGYGVKLDDDGYYVEDKYGRFLFPVGSDGHKRRFIASHKGKTVYKMTEGDVSFMLSSDPDFMYEEAPEDHEYVYSRAEQAELNGHKFQKVRAKLSRFYRENDTYTVPLTTENLSPAYEILKRWQPKSGDGDFGGALKALENYTELGMRGAMTYIGKDAVGYCCGADIGSGVFMLCSAKQISDVQGLNLCTKNELYKTLPESFEFINTESDHGSAGIRMHKNDLRPVSLIKMYKGVI